MRKIVLSGALALALSGGSLTAEPAVAQAYFNGGGGSFAVSVRSLRDIPFRTVVRQQFDYSCGSAALATLLHYHYGSPATEGQVFKAMYDVGDQAKIQKVGFSLLDMKRYLNDKGYRADGFRMTLAQLEAAQVPAITVVQNGPYKHFVVIKGVRSGKVLVGDPALGLKTYDAAEFEKMWNGVVFAIRGVAPQNVAYNRESEWRPYANAPLNEQLSDATLSQMTRELPPLYQLTPAVMMPEIPR
jgi:predicted double-glycine peptidase